MGTVCASRHTRGCLLTGASTSCRTGVEGYEIMGSSPLGRVSKIPGGVNTEKDKEHSLGSTGLSHGNHVNQF